MPARATDRIIGVACLAALLVTGAAAGQHSTEARADAAALASYDDAVAVLADAREVADVGLAELADARARAAIVVDDADALLEAVDEDLLDDPADANGLAAARDDLAAAVDAVAGYVAEAAPGDEADPADGELLASRDERVAEAVRALLAAGALEAVAQTADDLEGSLAERADAVTAATVTLGASAHRHGAATDAPELAGDEATDAYTAAVAALDGAGASDVPALLSAYQDAWAAAVASHEAAEAEAAARADAVAPPADASGGVQPTYVRGILVVNKTYALPSWFGAGLTAETSAAFERMRAEAAASGLDLYISSGFRSYASQKSIYDRYVANEGVAGADRHSARPGHSEHQSGLAFDLNTITEAFGYTAEGEWVAANAHRFGFIVRYPPGKEGVTGYVWEPWHLRYLGVGAASDVFASGLSLEEYLGVTSRYE
ncbi:M15 family metallopeptidase [Agromyces sp. SYSU T00194]|uniref:M15 family metallopeptidase n=1 Tax=Agromyces chitinivorans TaxID=3158560 RepID=UPI0033924F71